MVLVAPQSKKGSNGLEPKCRSVITLDTEPEATRLILFCSEITRRDLDETHSLFSKCPACIVDKNGSYILVL